MKISLFTLLTVALVLSPFVSSAQTTTERRKFSISLTGYRNGAFTESENSTGTVTYRQVRDRFRLATTDLIKLIGAAKGITNYTSLTRMTINGDDATYTIVNGKTTNTFAFDSDFSMDCWETSYAEGFSGNFNETTDRGTGSALSVETWNITLRIGAKTINLKGRVGGSERWNYNGATSSESNSQSIRVTGELIEGVEVCPVEGTISASYSRTTK